MKKKMSFESAMARLEEIAALLERGEISLEESIKVYEEGTQLLEFCENKLDEAEKKIQLLIRKPDGNFETKDLDATASQTAD
ncbi:MAG: exodeoxyribonuclease VII small subunit [Calditrichia bacterium]